MVLWYCAFSTISPLFASPTQPFLALFRPDVLAGPRLTLAALIKPPEEKKRPFRSETVLLDQFDTVL